MADIMTLRINQSNDKYEENMYFFIMGWTVPLNMYINRQAEQVSHNTEVNGFFFVFWSNQFSSAIKTLVSLLSRFS